MIRQSKPRTIRCLSSQPCTMLVTRSDDGYYGITRSYLGVIITCPLVSAEVVTFAGGPVMAGSRK